MRSRLPRILLVSSARQTENIATNEAFAARLNHDFDHSFRVSMAYYKDIAFVFEQGAPRAFVASEQLPLDDFALVYLKSYKAFNEHASALAECLRAAKVPFIGEELGTYTSVTKLSQYARLTAAGLPVPKAVFVDSSHLKEQYALLVENLGVPFVLKDIDGYGGQHNFLVKSETHFRRVLHDSPGVSFVAQQFIANDRDLRVLVVGGKARLVIARQRLDNSTHLNNTSQGAKADLVPLNELGTANVRLAEQAAALFRREIAGVDLMFETGTGRAFLLEVNACPQVASGAFADEKIALIGQYLTQRVKK